MQIFSLLRTVFSGEAKHTPSRRGFTLIELLISIGIMGIVSTIILVKYNSFDSTTLLKSTAYEIGLALREAQIKSVSAVRGVNGSFEYPVGVSFKTDNKNYNVFQYASTDLTKYPKFVDTTNPTFPLPISITTIGRTMEVDDVCVYGTALLDPCNVDRLDISFRRPEFKALMFAAVGGTSYSNTITEAKIFVASTQSGSVGRFIVTVSSLGQISVAKE